MEWGLRFPWDVDLCPVRKPGKLPYETFSQEYALEYGTDAVEVHQDALKAGQRVIVVDDVLATGHDAGDLSAPQ